MGLQRVREFDLGDRKAAVLVARSKKDLGFILVSGLFVFSSCY